MSQPSKFTPGPGPGVQPLRPEHGGPREPSPPEPDFLGLGDLVGILFQHLWLIAGVAAAFAIGGVVYALVATPVYRSDAVVQVEDKGAKGSGALDELSGMLAVATPAQAELEIIRSRALLGAAVDELRRDLRVAPERFPLVGEAIARRRGGDELAPPLLGLSRYAWGGERIQVTRLDVAPALEGVPLTLVAGAGGAYELRSRDGDRLLQGRVGEAAADPAGRVQLHVAELRAHEGTRFSIRRLHRDDVIADLRGALQIREVGKQTGIIELTLQGPDPRELAATLDAVARRYLRQNVERRSEEAEKTLSFLHGQLPTLKANLVAAEEALSAYRLKHGSVDVSLEAKGALDKVVDVEKATSELELQRAELAQRFTENHPALLSLRDKLVRLRQERGAVEERMKRLPESELELARLMRDVKVANELYVLLLNKVQELNVVKSGTIGNVRIVDAALVPRLPIAPRKARVVLFALAMGVAAGVSLVLVKRALSRGVEDPDVVERETGLGVYATVPHSSVEERHAGGSRRRNGGEVLASSDAHDLAVESIRSLRTSLQFALADASSNVVGILGPAPGVGKSFVAVNLAHVAAEAGLRVALVDADLRKGRLHRHFGGERERGLSEAIAGTLPLAEALRPTRAANLSFVATGLTPPNPAELLASERFGRLLRELSSTHDLVVVDTPPVLAVTDAAIVSRLAGVNLLVLRSGKHPLREIQAAVKRVEHGGAVIHGAVLNDVSTGLGHRKYHFYYGYGTPDGK